MKNKKGFTLIELLAVIVVLAIVMVLAATSVLPYISNVRKDAFYNDVLAVRDAAGKAVDLIALGQVKNNFTKTTDGYSFTVSNLKNLGLIEDTTIAGTIEVKTTQKNKQYKLSLSNENYKLLTTSYGESIDKSKISANDGSVEPEPEPSVEPVNLSDTIIGLAENCGVTCQVSHETFDVTIDGGKTTYDAGYRYQGATVNNYVSINGETWRILSVEKGSTIGLTGDDADKYYTKIVKVLTSSNKVTKKYYNSGLATIPSYSETVLHQYLNGDTAVSADVKGMAVSVDWYFNSYCRYGCTTEYNTNQFYLEEREVTDANKANDKVGVAYPSDYGYAFKDDGCVTGYLKSPNASCLLDNWYLELVKGLNNSTTLLLAASDATSAWNYAWYLKTDGSLTVADATASAGAPLPTVYLSSDVVIKPNNGKLGTGTSEDPYILDLQTTTTTN